MPALAWFDRILADVGDSQNLQASLSTFSGHIRRVSTILDSLTEHSLVLLDEVSPGNSLGHIGMNFRRRLQPHISISRFRGYDSCDTLVMGEGTLTECADCQMMLACVMTHQ